MSHQSLWHDLPAEIRSMVDLAYFSGSRLAGLEHAASDADLHVVVKPGLEGERRRVQSGSVELQVTFESAERLRRVLDDCDEFLPTPTDRRPYSWTSEEERTAYRLFHSDIVHASAEWSSRLDTAWREHMPQAFMGSWAIRAARYAEDFDGMVRREGSDPAELLYVASQSFFTAANVALASLGDVYVSSKFLMRRLQRRGELRSVTKLAESLLYSSDLPLEERALALHGVGQYLVAASLTGNWEGELKGIDDGYGSPDLSRNAMAPGFGLIRYHESWSLAGVPKSYRVDAAGARAWLSLAPQVDGECPADGVLAKFVHIGIARERSHPGSEYGNGNGGALWIREN